MQHSIPKIIDPLDFELSPAMQVTVYKRHKYCLVLSETDQCSVCQIADVGESKRLSRASRKMQTPVKDKASLSNTSHDRLVISLKEKRLECKELREKVEEMRTSIRNNSVSVASELNNSNNNNKSVPHILAGCGALAQSLYLARHNNALKILFFQVIRALDLVTSEVPWFSKTQSKPR